MFRKKYILTIMLFNICFGQNWLQNQRLERQFKDAVSSYNEGRYATTEKILNNLVESGYDSFMEEALLLLLKSYFHEGIKNTVKIITINLKKAIPPKIHLQPKIGNKT